MDPGNATEVSVMGVEIAASQLPASVTALERSPFRDVRCFLVVTSGSAVLILLRRVVASEVFESFAVVGGSGALQAAFPEVGPGRYMCGRVVRGQDQGGERASDLVDGRPDQAALVLAAGGAPFSASAARTMVRNAAPAMDRVMWAYQAS